MGFMKKLGGMDPRLPRGKTGKGPSEPMVVRPRSSKPSGKKRNMGMGMGMMGLSKGPGMKSGKTVKMNMGMQVPNYQDTVRTRFAEGGKFGSIETRPLKPSESKGVQNKQVGTPTQMKGRSAEGAALARADAAARLANLATNKPAATSTPNVAGRAAAQASLNAERRNFGGGSSTSKKVDKQPKGSGGGSPKPVSNAREKLKKKLRTGG